MTASYPIGYRVGKLRLLEEVSLSSGSAVKVKLLCDCGRRASIQFRDFVSRLIGCGKCTVIPSDEMTSRKFGKLRMLNPIDVFPSSNKKHQWVCDCGLETTARIQYGY